MAKKKKRKKKKKMYQEVKVGNKIVLKPIGKNINAISTFTAEDIVAMMNQSGGKMQKDVPKYANKKQRSQNKRIAKEAKNDY